MYLGHLTNECKVVVICSNSVLTEFTVHLLSYWLMHFLAWFTGIFICTFNSQREGTHFLPYIMLKAAGFHVITTATEIELIESFKKKKGQ